MKAHITKINTLLTEQVEKIGEGAYSKVYRSTINPSKVYIVAPNGDNAKEALMMVGRYGSTVQHLPKLTRIGDMTIKNVDYDIYETEYSVAPTGEAKEIGARLNTLWCEFKRANLSIITADTSNRYILVKDFIDSLASHNIPESIITALGALYIRLHSYGDNCWLEFPMRNLAMDANGTLILRDIAFFVDCNAKW